MKDERMDIFFTALNGVFNNFGAAIKVSLVPTILLVVATIAIWAGLGMGSLWLTGSDLDPDALQVLTQNTWAIGVGLFLTLFLWIFVIAWIAIGWHRYMLEGAPVSIFPSFRDLPLGPYVWRSFVLGLIVLALTVALSLVVGMLGFVFGQLGIVGIVLTAIAFIALFVFVTAFWMRIASTLPAIAVGRSLPIGAGLEQTYDIKRQVLWASVGLLVFSFVLGLVQIPFESLFVSSTVVIVGLIVSIIGSWIQTMVGIGVLTEIYKRTGHRPSTEIFE